jgi:hypothetical protein
VIREFRIGGAILEMLMVKKFKILIDDGIFPRLRNAATQQMFSSKKMGVREGAECTIAVRKKPL